MTITLDNQEQIAALENLSLALEAAEGCGLFHKLYEEYAVRTDPVDAVYDAVHTVIDTVQETIDHFRLFKAGDRVITPGGLATVAYRHMSDFDPIKVGYVAVKLDNSYSSINSIYPAREVSFTKEDNTNE